MKKIVIRDKELSILKTMAQSKEAEFLAICGRRRVGKTLLIHSFFEGERATYFSAAGTRKGTMAEQIANFMDRLGEVFYGGAQLLFQ